ncbi:amino acid permease [Lactobacillus sp. LL6]|uniref:amino acid permease n=1 Tax=Lactobacillus sp. LL6 TaxID=2596827 RepID=UPI001184831D|nr:amino acid permease [Lactobacillus sp. LL6]TSO26978.1 amino acid permease [Lactobacillus sp. LL6]
MNEKKTKLNRGLKSRHVTMIAIGGAIGTGLFLGSGSAIRSAGPSIILSYLIVGIITFFMMRALGELILADTEKHSFLDAVKEYLGDRVEFVAGWIYWACWLTLAMADLTATGIYLRYWFPWLPQWVGPLVIVVLLMLINMVDVGLFGELESWFSMIKVIAIIALILTGAVLLLLHTNVAGRPVSLSNLFNHGGFFPTGGWGFMMSFQMVVFAFVGVEIVGLTAGETSDPDKDIPKAINTLPVRIGLFYIGSMLAIMAVYPWNKIQTTSSPFVQVFGAIGIVGAAGILNFVVLTAAMSATNSAIFSTSRSLYALARGGNAPKKLGELSNKAVPNNALTVSSLILFVIVILNYLMPAKIFDVVSTVSTICFIIVWMIIMWAHIKYRQANKNNLGSFRMPGYPITSWLTLIFYFVILVILFFIESTRLPLIISIIFVVLLWGCYGLVEKHKN